MGTTLSAPPINPIPTSGGDPPQPPPITQYTWNCHGDTVGADPGGPATPIPVGGGGVPGGGGWLNNDQFAKLLKNSGCYKPLWPCDPETAPAGTIVVIWETTARFLGIQWEHGAGPAIAVHSGTSTGGGNYNDKPGLLAEQTGNYEQFIAPFTSGALFSSSGNPVGTWTYDSVLKVWYLLPTGETGPIFGNVYKIRYVLCYTKIC